MVIMLPLSSPFCWPTLECYRFSLLLSRDGATWWSDFVAGNLLVDLITHFHFTHAKLSYFHHHDNVYRLSFPAHNETFERWSWTTSSHVASKKWGHCTTKKCKSISILTFRVVRNGSGAISSLKPQLIWKLRVSFTGVPFFGFIK